MHFKFSKLNSQWLLCACALRQGPCEGAGGGISRWRSAFAAARSLSHCGGSEIFACGGAGAILRRGAASRSSGSVSTAAVREQCGHLCGNQPAGNRAAPRPPVISLCAHTHTPLIPDAHCVCSV